jgi:hypothetical protein
MALLAASLAGCESISDRTAAAAITFPGEVSTNPQATRPESYCELRSEIDLTVARYRSAAAVFANGSCGGYPTKLTGRAL